MPKPIKPTIYLIKKDVSDPDDIFKDVGQLKKESSNDILLYYRPSFINKPKWREFIAEYFDVDVNNFENKPSWAAIVVPTEGRYLVVTLGLGIHLLDMNKIEYNFGLKIALNCIPNDELRQIDLTSPESSGRKTKK